MIPVVDEPLDLFHDVLARIVEQRPDQIVVVINGPRNPALEEVCDAFPEVDWIWTADRRASATPSTIGVRAPAATSWCSSTATPSGRRTR